MNKLSKFTFTTTDKAPDPDLGSERIPVDRYTDPAFIKVEDDKIWSKTWLLAGLFLGLLPLLTYMNIDGVMGYLEEIVKRFNPE